jgi:hypothetical protein
MRVSLGSVFGIAATSVPKATVNGRPNDAMSAMMKSIIPTPRVKACATLLDKQNGALRVGTTGVSEISIGEVLKELRRSGALSKYGKFRPAS